MGPRLWAPGAAGSHCCWHPFCPPLLRKLYSQAQAPSRVRPGVHTLSGRNCTDTGSWCGPPWLLDLWILWYSVGRYLLGSLSPIPVGLPSLYLGLPWPVWFDLIKKHPEKPWRHSVPDLRSDSFRCRRPWSDQKWGRKTSGIGTFSWPWFY